MTVTIHLTPTQQKLMDILQDRRPHPVAQLWACLGDELSNSNNLRMHISLLRTKLRREGTDIHCNEYGGTTYQLIRLIVDDE